MIDIHTHVLPEIDDGAESMQQAIEMMRLAAAAGTTDIVATPHANLRYRFDPVCARERLAQLTEAAGAGMPRLHLGCELHLTYDLMLACLRSPQDYTIAGGTYLLLEFPDERYPESATDIVARLVGSGLRPIVAHPERTHSIRDRMDVLRSLAELGCLFQITAGSLAGRFGKQSETAARALLKCELANVVASDGHDDRNRQPSMHTAFGILRGEFGEERALTLCRDNPRAVLENRDLPPPRVAAQPSRLRKWLQFVSSPI